jgi:alkyldihydroxyacetonephosphate synthase
VTAADALADLIGSDRVTAGEATASFARDWSSRSQLAARRGVVFALPICVVSPSSTEDVAAILRWAHETKTPVVPFGGGSGVCEGIDGSERVVISLQAMDRVIEIDERSRLVRVQAGIAGPALDRRLEDDGFKLGHEPQSVAISTVGGWIATRATGQLSSRYGGIERLLAGFEAVLPGGHAVRSKTTPRRATGPDVAGLMIGSEGTLGIVTEATLRISPAAVARSDRCLRFVHMADGVAACRVLAQSDLTPSVVRLYDQEDSEIFLRSHPDEPRGPLLLLSFEGEDADRRAAQAIEIAGGERGNDDLVGYWWAHRNDAVDGFRELMAGHGILGPHALVDTIEVSGTWSVLRSLYHQMRAALEPLADIVGCHLSHVYTDGGCLYFTLASACADDDAAESLYDRWWGTAMQACLAAGGSISHHHGIGRLKAAWLPAEMEGWFDVLAAVKAAVDPHRIMNPGALGL